MVRTDLHGQCSSTLHQRSYQQKDYYTFFCEYLFPPDSLTGTAPDDAAILVWDPPLEYWPLVVNASNGPKYSKSVSEFIPGTESDPNSINRSEANDIVTGTAAREISAKC